MTDIQVHISEPKKPNQLVIRFNGNITRDGQDSGLPETVYAFLIVQDLGIQDITKLVEDQSRAFIGSQAMFVQRDQGQIVDLRISPLDRMLVPFHNIACITVDLVNMNGELSEPDENGVERLTDGKEPLKQ